MSEGLHMMFNELDDNDTKNSIQFVKIREDRFLWGVLHT